MDVIIFVHIVLSSFIKVAYYFAKNLYSTIAYTALICKWRKYNHMEFLKLKLENKLRYDIICLVILC